MICFTELYLHVNVSYTQTYLIFLPNFPESISRKNNTLPAIIVEYGVPFREKTGLYQALLTYQ